MSDLIDALRTVADYAATMHAQTVKAWCIERATNEEHERKRYIAIGRSLSSYLGPVAAKWGDDMFAELGETAARASSVGVPTKAEATE